MIIDNGYFIDEIFIPHAKPSVTDSMLDLDNDIVSFIENYSKECLIECLGYGLYKAFSNELDVSTENGLKATADSKWNDLLNGKEYTDSRGELCIWPGIVTKTGDTKNKSFIADYVYFFYEKSSDDSRVGIGNVKETSKNSVQVSKRPKVVNAWRNFTKKVQGNNCTPDLYVNRFGLGMDWYGSRGDVKTLYAFINDMNSIDRSTYEGFRPKLFNNINIFDI